MENARDLRQRAEEHRAAAHQTPDLWESVIRLTIAARYDDLAARRETLARRDDAADRQSPTPGTANPRP